MEIHVNFTWAGKLHYVRQASGNVLIDTKHPALMHTSLSKDLTEKEELPTQLPNYGGRKAHVLAK